MKGFETYYEHLNSRQQEAQKVIESVKKTRAVFLFFENMFSKHEDLVDAIKRAEIKPTPAKGKKRSSYLLAIYGNEKVINTNLRCLDGFEYVKSPITTNITRYRNGPYYLYGGNRIYVVPED